MRNFFKNVKTMWVDGWKDHKFMLFWKTIWFFPVLFFLFVTAFFVMILTLSLRDGIDFVEEALK